MAVEVYFFGCWTGMIGHHLWRNVGGRYESCRHDGLVPWQNIDGALTPGFRLSSRLYAIQDNYVESREQVEGHASLHHHDGWTALAWWDRSVDKRYGSNAAVFARGTYSAERVLELGREHFPYCLTRFSYDIEVKGSRHEHR